MRIVFSSALRGGLVACLVAGVGCSKASPSHSADTDDTMLQLRRSMQMHESGSLASALILCDTVLKRESRPKYRALILLEMTDLHVDLKDYSAALTNAEEAVRLDPGNFRTYFGRAYASTTLYDYQGAMRDYSEAIRLDPNNPRLLSARGDCQFQFGFYDAAIREYSSAIAVSPQTWRPLSGRAKVYMEIGDYMAAARDLRAAIELSPKNENLFRSYGISQLRLGKKYEARRYFEEVATLHSRSPAEHVAVIGSCYIRAWDFREGLGLYNAAIEQDSTVGAFFADRALVNCCIGDFKDALQDIQRSIELGPDESTGYKLRAWLHVIDGRYELAMKDGQRAIDLDPDSEDNYLVPGEAAVLAGDKSRALDVFNAGVKLSTEKARIWLWQRMLGGADEKLVSYLLQFSPDKWPYPIVRFQLGQMTAEELMQHAQHPNSLIAKARVSEASFYIGWRLAVSGDPEAANVYFVKASGKDEIVWDTCILAQKQLSTHYLERIAHAEFRSK